MYQMIFQKKINDDEFVLLFEFFAILSFFVRICRKKILKQQMNDFLQFLIVAKI